MTTDNTLQDLAEWIDEARSNSDQPDRAETQAANKLARLAGAVQMAEAIDTHTATIGDAGVIVALNRGPGREHLADVVALPMVESGRKVKALKVSPYIDEADTVMAVLAVIDDECQFLTVPIIDDDASSASSKNVLRTLTGHESERHAVQVSRKAVDEKGRQPWTFTVVAPTTGTRGRAAAQTI